MDVVTEGNVASGMIVLFSCLVVCLLVYRETLLVQEHTAVWAGQISRYSD